MKDYAYLEMRAYLFHREESKTVVFKLQELATLWYCTVKNAKRKLKAYEEQSLLRYKPGKGRGNSSTLEFLRPFQAELEEDIENCINTKNHDLLMNLLQLPLPKHWIMKASPKLQQVFGLQSENLEKDCLRGVIRRNITTIDPLYSSIVFENHLIEHLGDTLVVYNEEADRVEPHLAHHWTVSNDHKTWTFYLRKGVHFHHGKTLTSKDVHATIERFKHHDAPLKWLLQDIETIEFPSPFVVTFHLTYSNPFFVRYLTSGNLSILPSDIPFHENEWIGTGPFTLKERTENKIVIEAFDHYFLERPLLDRVEFWKVPPDTVNAMLLQVDGSESEESQAQRLSEVEPGFRFLAFNYHKNPIFHNPYFRELIFHILDIEKMWKDLNRTDLIHASSFLPERSKKIKKNPAMITELLQKSHYTGEPLKLFTFVYPKAIEESQWLTEQASRFGIQLDMQFYNFEEFYTDKIEKEADLIFSGEVAARDKHLSFLGAFYNEALLFRRLLPEMHYKHISSFLENIKSADNYSAREYWIAEIESYILKHHLFVYLFHPIRHKTFDPMIKNMEDSTYGQVNFKKIWIQNEIRLIARS